MLGMDGIAVPLGFILTISSTILCIAYGIKNWNKGYVTEEELEQEQLWREENSIIQDNL